MICNWCFVRISVIGHRKILCPLLVMSGVLNYGDQLRDRRHLILRASLKRRIEVLIRFERSHGGSIAQVISDFD